MIEFIGVAKKYPNGADALCNINLRIAREELVFVTGHSGAGKSTLLKLIAKIEPVTRGQIIIAGKPLAKLPESRVPYFRRKLGLILQNPQLLPKMTVFENVALPLHVVGASIREIDHKVHAALDLVSLLSRDRRYPEQLSTGEQQRVAIARAIVNRPTIILADEPTGNLDPELAADIMKLFVQLNQLGTTMVIASHNLSLIARLRYRILKLQNGKLVSNV